MMAILLQLEMAFAMMRPTMQNVIMMGVIVVDLALLRNIAQNVNVLAQSQAMVFPIL